MKPVDKTAQQLKEEYDALHEMETATNRRDIRAARKQLKKRMARHERQLGERTLKEQLAENIDDTTNSTTN